MAGTFAPLLGLWVLAMPAAVEARPIPWTRAGANLSSPPVGVSMGTAATTLMGGSAFEAAPAAADPAGPPPEPAADGDDDGATTKGSVLLRKRGAPPLWIDREFDTHRTRAMALPPVFVHRTPKAGHPEKLLHADLSLTFGWYSENAGRRRWFNPAVLFFGGFSERKTVWGAVPLLMGYRRVGEQFNFGQFPLVWWWGTKFVKNFLVVPFHYQQKTPDSFRAVSALLFWYGNKNLDDANLENDRRHFVAAPLFYRFQRGLKRFDFGFLYVGGKNELSGNKYAAVAPLFAWRSSEFGNRKELWTLPWIARTDAARRKSAWAVPLAMTFSSKSPDRELFSATPLFWRGRNTLRGSTTTVLGPFGHYDDPDQKNSVFAPLYFRFQAKQSRAATQIFVPFAVTRRSPDKTAVWTLVGGGRKTKNGFGFALPPALTFGVKRDDGRRLGAIAGVFWHSYRPRTEDQVGRSLWVAGPVGWVDKRSDGTRVGLPPLLTFGGRKGTKTYEVITPLFWHVRDRDPAIDRRTVVTGPFYHHKTKAGFEGGLAPLAFWGSNDRRRYAIVPWVAFGHYQDVRSQTALTISPLAVRSKGPDHTAWGALGIVWDVKRAGAERHTVLFPLYYRRQMGARRLTLTPLGGTLREGADRTSVYGPIVHRRIGDRRGWGLLPILWHDKKPVEGGTASHTVFVPLYLRRRTPSDDLDMISPLLWRTNIRGDRPRRGLAVVPFYFRQRGAVNVDAGLGFFWSRDPHRRTHTIIAGPAFHRLSRVGLHTGVAPIYWWHDSQKQRRLLSLPLIFHFEDKDQDEHTTVAIPLWFDRERANGRRRWAAFPFVFGGKNLYNFTRFSLAPPGFVDTFRLHKNYRFTGFLPFGFRYQKCGFRDEDDPKCRYQLSGSVPFFMYGKDGNGRRTHGALLAYYWDRSKDGFKFYTPVFGLNNQRGKELGWYAGGPLLAVKTTNTHRRVMVFPLYYRRAHRLEDRNLTLIAPPLFIGRKREERGFFEAGLLYWQFRQPHKVSVAVVPPVLFYQYAYKQRRLYWFLPLFIRDNHMAEDKAWTAIPVLYTQRRKGDNLDFVAFPIVWHIERGQNQGTFGAFAWWDIRVKGRMFQTVPGLFFRAKNQKRDLKMVGPALGWWTKGLGDDAGDRGWRALFGVFGAGVEDGRRYTALFGAKIDRGPAPGSTGEAQGKATSRRDGAEVERAAHRAARRSLRVQRRADRKADRQARRQARVQRRALARRGR